uniref:BTB domain-containing protein n=1 Tax=Panagrolaimus sp. ES5 TaxID=591445 RepID=A0AC34GN50_9BILA
MPFITQQPSIVHIPVSIRWKLLFSELLLECQVEKWSIMSEIFTIEKYPNLHYSLEISQGMIPDSPDRIGLGLFISIGDHPAVNANFKLSIPSANVSYQIEKVLKYDDTVRFAGKNICTYQDFFDPKNNYFVNDAVIFQMEGLLSVELREPLHPPSSAIPRSEPCCRLGSKLWDSDDDKDFIFMVDGKEIHAHKLIIGTESPVFKRMIHSGLKESKENKVIITDFDYQTVEIAIKYCYGIFEPSLGPGEAIKLLQFADKYDLTVLKTPMEKYLSSNISPGNVCKIVNAAILTNCQALRETCLDFMLQCQQEKYYLKDLDILDPEFAMELLKATFSRHSHNSANVDDLFIE